MEQLDKQGAFDFDKEEERLAHQENLERVSSRIAWAIVEFCQMHRRFHADELRKWVVAETGIAAPASADRVLRNLRARGIIRYHVVSRRESLYEVDEVKEVQPNGETNFRADQTHLHAR